MSSGLQRRRVRASSSGTAPSSPVTPTTQNNQTPQDSEAGHKIAYDPDDIPTNSTETKLPRLTLMEEVLLMGIKDKEGYLSFWNDNISYALRGCIILELAFRGKIQMVNDPARRRLELSERNIEVIDSTLTGEVLLDESLKLMKASEPMSVGQWIDLLSGETWNITKINYQLKQVRERLAKGLVDKGILRTERRNFFLFDMATHPLADTASKEGIKRRVISILGARTINLQSTPLFSEFVQYRHIRSISLVCGAYAANVLENVLLGLSYDGRDRAFARADELLTQFSEWPFQSNTKSALGVGLNLSQLITEELTDSNELQMEIVAAVLCVFSRMDSIL